jgi:hypothetical protein
VTEPLPDIPEFSSDQAVMQGLLRRYTMLGERASQIKQEMDAIKSRFRLLGRGQHDLGIGKVIVTPQKRFDPEVAEKVLRAIHPDLVEKCSISKLDSALTKQFVSGEVYERCQSPTGEDKVVIKS